MRAYPYPGRSAITKVRSPTDAVPGGARSHMAGSCRAMPSQNRQGISQKLRRRLASVGADQTVRLWELTQR